MTSTQTHTSRPTVWYYESAGERLGPCTQEDVLAAAKSGAITGATLVWRSGWSDWLAVEATELRDLVASAGAADDEAHTADDAGSGWYYELSGQRLGPVALTALQGLIDKGTLSHGALVWRAGWADWMPLERTTPGRQWLRSTPPPLAGAHISNAVVWTLALSPFLVAVLRYFMALVATHGNEGVAEQLVSQGGYWYLGPITSVALSYWDLAVLRKAGVRTQALGQAWLVPLYLFRRAKALRQSPAYAWVWLILFVLIAIGA